MECWLCPGRNRDLSAVAGPLNSSPHLFRCPLGHSGTGRAPVRWLSILPAGSGSIRPLRWHWEPGPREQGRGHLCPHVYGWSPTPSPRLLLQDPVCGCTACAARGSCLPCPYPHSLGLPAYKEQGRSYAAWGGGCFLSAPILMPGVWEQWGALWEANLTRLWAASGCVCVSVSACVPSQCQRTHSSATPGPAIYEDDGCWSLPHFYCFS